MVRLTSLASKQKLGYNFFRQFLVSAQDTNHVDETATTRAVDRLEQGLGAADLDDLVNALTICQALDFDIPIRSGVVIDQMRSTQLLRNLEFGVRRRCCDDGRPKS